MPSNLLDDFIIEVTGIAQKAVGNLVGMFDTAEDLVTHVEAAPPEFHPSILSLSVDLLDPRVMVGYRRFRNILLKLDDVVAGNRFRAGRRQDGSSAIVNGLNARGSRGQGGQEKG